MKLDILAIGVHPDDVELACSGTLLKHIDLGKKVGVLDLTEGQLGSRGSAEIRLKEAQNAAELLNLDVRVNLGMEDGWFQNDQESKLKIIRELRHFRPDVVLCNAVSDRHPDHGRAAKLVAEACFYAGLLRIETDYNGTKQEKWRPKSVFHYVQDRELQPDFVVDISEYFDKKIEAIQCFKTQFFNAENQGPETPISTKEFLKLVEGKARIYGRSIMTEFAEAYTVTRPIGVHDITELL